MDTGFEWLELTPEEEAQIERELRPELLKEIPLNTEHAIYNTLQKLRTLFPSYRDDQLFVFWLGRLAVNDVNIHDFNSTVSFSTSEDNEQ